ncbi:elongation factor G [candidate division WOR-3 bacterium]|nr:elongation factor G [candidate division WOR-3 bacterium]
MKKYEPEAIRNIVLMSHSGTGKTTLAEAALFNAKVTSRLGKVDNGTSILDYAPDEIERKISINLGIAWFEWNDKLINLIDTPGYADFWGDVIAGARVADVCVIPINATTGIQPGAENAKSLAEQYKIPIVIFVNQLGKENADFEKTFKEIKELFGKGVIPLTIPEGSGIQFKSVLSVLESDNPYKSDVLEAIAEVEDSLTEKYLNEEPFTQEDIARGLEIGIKNRKLIPLYSGDAYNNIGVKEFLDALPYLPSPSEREEAKQKDLSCLTFKTIVDPHLGELKYIRVFSGNLEAGTFVLNSTRKKEEKINQIYILKGKEREEVPSLGVGRIGALVKLKITQTGDTLTDKGNPITLSSLEFPEPQTSMAIIPKTKKDEEKVSNGLLKLHEESPTFTSFYDPETRQTIISGLGELQLDVILGKLKDKFGVEVSIERPRIHYRETITKSGEAQGKYKRQTGGHGQYGDCWVRFEPVERGKGAEFVDAIVGGRIPKRFIPSVEKGLKEALEKGILVGYPTTDFKMTLYDGSFHDVDSSDIAFKIAASMAFRAGMPECAPTLLEPIMKVEVIVPGEFMGDVMGDLSSRRGKIENTESMGKYQKVHAIVPETELYKFSTTLRSQTQGMGSFSQKFSHYEEVPKEIQKRIIEEHKKEKD